MSENTQVQIIGVSKVLPKNTKIYVIPSLTRSQFGRAIDILSLLFRSQAVAHQVPCEAIHSLMRLEALSALDKEGLEEAWIRIELGWIEDALAFSIIVDSGAATILACHKALEAKPRELVEATKYLTGLSIQKSGKGTRATLDITATLSRKDTLSQIYERAAEAAKVNIETFEEKELETISPKHEYQALPSVESMVQKVDDVPRAPSMSAALVAAVKVNVEKEEEQVTVLSASPKEEEQKTVVSGSSAPKEEESVTVVSGSYEEEDEEEEIRISGSKEAPEPEKVVRFKSSPKKKKEKSVTVVGSSAQAPEEGAVEPVAEEVVLGGDEEEVEEATESVSVVSSGPSVSELNSSVTRIRKSKSKKVKSSMSVPPPTNNVEEIIQFFKTLENQDEAIAALEKWFNDRIARAIVRKTVGMDQIEQLMGRVTKNPELSKQLIEIIHALPNDADEDSQSQAAAEDFVAGLAKNGPADMSVARLEKSLAEKEKSLDFYQKKAKELEERLAAKIPDNPEDSYFKKRMQELEAEVVQANQARKENDAAIRKRELDIQQAETRLVRKFEEAEARAKMAERLLASNAESEKAATQVADNQSKLDQGMDKLQASMLEAREQIGDEKAKAVLDAAMGELNAQRADMNEKQRAIAGEMKKQEFQFNNKLAMLQEEVRQAKVIGEQKDTQVDRMKELVNRVQEKYETERANAARITNEATQIKMAAEQFRRQHDEAMKEIERLKKRTEAEAAEKQNAAGGGGQMGQLNKQLAESQKNLLAKKQEVEQLKRQLNEKVASEAEMKKQLAKLQGQQGAQGAAAGAQAAAAAKKLKAG